MSDDKQLTFINRDNKVLSFEELKNDYICSGSSVPELATKYNLPVAVIQNAVTQHKLEELRKAHIKHGLATLQNTQIAQADKLMNMEATFKQMRISQLEKMLQDYAAYFDLHGHFYRINPITKEILKDINQIPIPIKLPNVTKEITELKESVSLSEGLKNVLAQIELLINPTDGKDEDLDLIDVTSSSSFDNLFSKKNVDEE